MEFRTTGGEPSDRRSELSWLLRAGLGHPVDDKTLDRLAAAQTRLQDRRDELVDLLSEKSITREQFLKELEVALKQAAKFGEDILGYENYHKVFGDFDVRSMIDPIPFFKSGPSE